MYFVFFTSIVGVAVLAVATPQSVKQTAGIAIPIRRYSEFLNAGGNLDFHALGVHVLSVKAFENYERNTGVKHPSSPKHIQKRANGVALTLQSYLWEGVVSVGLPPKQFTVMFDSGSSDFFLTGLACVYGEGHTHWDPASSLSSVDLHLPVAIHYANGAVVTGNVFNDTVSIASFTAQDQMIAVANFISQDFEKKNFPSDGLMGLAFQSVSEYGGGSIIDTLVSEGSLSEPVFSFKLSQPGAELYIGGQNSELYVGDITFLDVISSGFWEVKLDNIMIEGNVVLSDMHAIIDTGSALVFGPLEQITTFYEEIGGRPVPESDMRGYYMVPCETFPTISFTFGGTTFPLLHSAVDLGSFDLDPSYCVSGIVAEYKNVGESVVI